MLLLVILLGMWITIRSLLWQSPFELPAATAAPTVTGARMENGAQFAAAVKFSQHTGFVAGRPHSPGAERHAAAEAAQTASPPWVDAAQRAPSAAGHLDRIARFSLPGSRPIWNRRPPAFAARRQQLPLVLAGQTEAAPRWSGDAWLLVRGGGSGGSSARGGLRPGYGDSQAGAVLRYRLMPASAHRLAAYLRIDGALRTPAADREVAAGLAVRPVAGIPVALLAEGRVVRSGSAVRLRPAVALVTELAPQRLPVRLEAEFYGQAGYVGGAGATPFFDAQLAIDRPVAQPRRNVEVRLGAGAWTGGQRGAARLDIGPRASARFATGRAAARLSLDWRFRVAGNAVPGSGPALTLSAGF